MTQQTSMDREARNILIQNDRGGYTIPTEGLYPYQWNWDSAFAALGFAQFDLDRAWQELETLFFGQWDNGMVPHILFHKPDPGYFPGPDVWGGTGPIPSSGISQPPIAPSFSRMIWEKDRTKGEPHLRALYPKMRAWLRWFMDWRLDDGAVCITHPWEAGRDNAPDWDSGLEMIDPSGVGEYTRRDTGHVNPEMRPTKYDYDRYIWLVQMGNRLGWDEAKLLEQNPFRIADPTMTFTLLRATRDVLFVGTELGLDTAGLAEDIATLEAGAGTLWNSDLGCFDSRNARSGGFAGCVSNASFLCWYAGLDRTEMVPQLNRIMDAVAHPIPSHDPASPKFDAKRYWRGPTWAVMNMLIGLGLEEQGHAQGRALRAATGRLISTFGFAEYFDPTTGDPAGGNSFTWTAAVWLSWAGRA